MIADIAHALNEFRPLDQTLELISERVAAVNANYFVTIWLVEKSNNELRLRGSWGIQGIAERTPALQLDDPHLVNAPSVQAFGSGHTQVLVDAEKMPSFEPWRAAARASGFCSMICTPIIQRGNVIGVLNTYRQEPYEPDQAELSLLSVAARMAAVAIETVRIAESQRAAAKDLRAMSERLQIQNAHLSKVSWVQGRLIEALLPSNPTVIARIAQVVADGLECSIAVCNATGRLLAGVGPPEETERMASVAARAAVLTRLRYELIVHLQGCTCIRIGQVGSLLGALVLKPSIDAAPKFATVIATHAAAVLAAHLLSERADRALDDYARPAVLLGVCHGLYLRSVLSDAAAVLGVSTDARVRVAQVDLGSEEAANKRARQVLQMRSVGWPALAAVAEGCSIIVLLDASYAANPPSRPWDADAAIAIGVSAVVCGLGELPLARNQARVAASLSRSLGTTVHFDRVGPLTRMAGDLPIQYVQRVVMDCLGEILASDKARGTQLMATLRAFIECDGRMAETARALGIHVNTLSQRLHRASELGGFDLKLPRDLSRVVLALEWATGLQL
jgi:hypothetical protein